MRKITVKPITENGKRIIKVIESDISMKLIKRFGFDYHLDKDNLIVTLDDLQPSTFNLSDKHAIKCVKSIAYRLKAKEEDLAYSIE